MTSGPRRAATGVSAATCGAEPAITTGKDGRMTVRLPVGAFLPAVIKGRRTDVTHGLTAAFSYATPLSGGRRQRASPARGDRILTAMTPEDPA